MTTTETSPPGADWLEQIAPTALREEGEALLAEVLTWRDSLVPALARIKRFFDTEDAQDQANHDALAAALGSERSIGAQDGLSHILGTLTHAVELNGTLANMGFDPDNLPVVDGAQG